MDPVVVTLRAQPRSMGCLWVMFVGMGLLFGSITFNPNTPMYLNPLPAAFGLLVGAVPSLIGFARRWAVQQVDDRGLVLRNGKLFPWADLRGIQKVKVMKAGRMLREDYALGFKGGGVRIRSNEYEDVAPLWAYLDDVARRSSKG